MILPKLYSIKDLPVDKEEIATPEKITEWKYLKSITKEIVQNDYVCIGLLIGANFMKVLEPMQVIASENGRPYAYKTRVGWCIVQSIMNGDNKDSISCHRVVVRNASTSQMALHHFGVKDSIKDITLEEMFKMMYKSFFFKMNYEEQQESVIRRPNVSVYFGKGTVKKDVHYVIPLPFRNENLVMPNNRFQTLRKLKCLKRRFLKDERFFKDYKKFMNDLLIKGYAKRADIPSLEKTWYIPHHGVYHPSKAGKMCVVFDCSAEFQGRSIN